jgi:hypothetical protein
LLLFFRELAEEVSEVLGDSFTLAGKHSLLTALKVVRVTEFACFELFNLVEEAIKLFNRLLN